MSLNLGQWRKACSLVSGSLHGPQFPVGCWFSLCNRSLVVYMLLITVYMMSCCSAVRVLSQHLRNTSSQARFLEVRILGTGGVEVKHLYICLDFARSVRPYPKPSLIRFTACRKYGVSASADLPPLRSGRVFLSDRTRTGVFNVIWPLAKAKPLFLLQEARWRLE